MKKNYGKLIVITGPDGCGKATQTKFLVEKLKQQNFTAETIDFPQYENNFFGKMVGRYLKGEFGKATEVSPYLASILYAGDRFESKSKINDLRKLQLNLKYLVNGDNDFKDVKYWILIKYGNADSDFKLVKEYKVLKVFKKS